MDIAADLREWSFFKDDCEAEYIQLPMDHEHRELAMDPLRNPDAGDGASFHPKDLLFGSAAEVIHNNCFPRLPSVLVNRIFGIPSIGYFGDFGAQVPSKLSPIALRTSGSFCEIIGILPKVPKTEFANSLVFLCLKGTPPRPPNGMPLRI